MGHASAIDQGHAHVLVKSSQARAVRSATRCQPLTIRYAGLTAYALPELARRHSIEFDELNVESIAIFVIATDAPAVSARRALAALNRRDTLHAETSPFLALRS